MFYIAVELREARRIHETNEPRAREARVMNRAGDKNALAVFTILAQRANRLNECRS